MEVNLSTSEPGAGAQREPRVPVPLLLHRALRRYGQAIRTDLATGGFGDLPPTGSWLLGALSRGPRTPTELAAELGWTKQALSRVADALVGCGFASRRADDHDRRRQVLSLTERGQAAATTVAAATRRADARLAALLDPAQRQALRRALTEFAADDREPS